MWLNVNQDITSVNRFVERLASPWIALAEPARLKLTSNRGPKVQVVQSRPHSATILAADAVGYSRAMSRDEVMALRALAASKDVIFRAIADHGGRVFATAGDSVLAEFAEAALALRAAIAIQTQLAEAAGRSQLLTYRIGLHHGLVHPSGTDLLGDTVNIAARLESLAYPGGICLSGQVQALADGLADLELIELGPQVLKNIEGPVRVLRLPMGIPEETGAEAPRRATTIAVRAFTASPGEADLYLAEGLAEDLVIGLSRFQSLAVLGPASVGDASPARLAADLAVAFVIGGKLRRTGQRLHIALDLTDARTGRTLWADRVEAAPDDLLAMQDDVMQRLVATLAGRIEELSIDASRRKRPGSAQAFDLLLQGIHHANRLDRASNLHAIGLIEAAVQRDPDYALAWAWLALMRLRQWAWRPDVIDLAPVRADAARALALDPSESWCHLVAGQVALYARELEAAEVHHKKALALNPFDCHIMALRSPLATYLGKPEEGIDWATRALSLNPAHPSWYITNLGLAQYAARRYGEAAATYATVPEPQVGVLAGLAAARAQMGDRAGAQSAARAVLALEPGFSAALFLGMRPFKRAEDRDHLAEGFMRAGLG
jgi:adenylate cyclase